MKNKIFGLLLSVMIFIGVATGCSVPNIEGNATTATVSTAKQTVINDLLNTAENKSDHALVEGSCTLAEFNRYNMPMEIYNRITVDMYISDVSEDIGISTLRKVGDGYYSVHTIKIDEKTNAYGFIMYNNEGLILDGWCTDRLKTDKDFYDIVVDKNISEVYKIDPYYCYLENTDDNNATTYHKLAKGKELVINYIRENDKSDFVVSSKQTQTDDVGFTNMLIKNDMKLIEK